MIRKPVKIRSPNRVITTPSMKKKNRGLSSFMEFVVDAVEFLGFHEFNDPDVLSNLQFLGLRSFSLRSTTLMGFEPTT